MSILSGFRPVRYVGEKVITHVVKAGSARAHWHTEFELDVVLSGGLSVLREREWERLDEGGVVLFNPRQEHSMEGIGDCVILALLFSPRELGIAHPDYLKYQFDLYSGQGGGLPEELIEIRSLACGIALECLERAEGYRIISYGNLCRIIAMLFRSSAVKVACLEDVVRLTDIADFVEVFNVLQGHLSADAQTIAAQMDIPVIALERLIDRTVNMTFTQLLAALRTEEASRLLQETQLSIVEISEECGFSSISAFYRNFHSSFGMNPNEYRKGPFSVEENGYRFTPLVSDEAEALIKKWI